MSTGIVIAIVVVVVVLIALLALMPRLKGVREERQLKRRRNEVAGRHRSEAETRQARAEVAEQTARRERAEAELHESRAKLHDQGLADDELRDDRRGDAAPDGRDVRDERQGDVAGSEPPRR